VTPDKILKALGKA